MVSSTLESDSVKTLSMTCVRAGDGNRTRMASLEGWSSTIELHPRALSGLLSLERSL